MLKAILFDMDGVIIDSEPLHARAAIKALQKFGVPLTTDFCYSFIGSTAKHMLEVIKEKWQLPFSLDTLMTANQEAKKELLALEGYPVIPGVRELMEALHQGGYKIAIASSSPLAEISETVKRLTLGNFLQEIVSGMQVPNPKPAPDIFLCAAKALGVSASECLVIEDSSNGLRAAKAAGMSALAFHNPNSGRQDLGMADYVIEGFDEITPDFLEQIYQHANNLPAVIAKSDRLTLRELCMQDIPFLHKILSEPSVTRFSGEPFRSLEELLQIHEAYIPGTYHFRGYGLWGVFLNATGELIGRCGFETASPAALADTNCDSSCDAPSVSIEIGYLISERFQGQGYAAEAISMALATGRRFGFSKIFAVIHPDNAASLHLAKKMGMEPVGTTMRNGIACPTFCLDYSIQKR